MGEIGDVLLVTNPNSGLSTRNVKNKKFLEAIVPIARSVRLVGGSVPSEFEEKISASEVECLLESPDDFVQLVINHLYTQLLLIYLLFKHREEYGTVILFMGYPGPAIAGRLLGKYVIRFHGGPSLESEPLGNLVVNRIPNKFSNRILVPSKGCVEHFGIEHFQSKIEFAHFHISDSFKPNVPYDERQMAIGYLGHLKSSKGVDTLVRAFRITNDRIDETVCLELGGTGPLLDELKLDAECVRYRGWIDHDDTVDFYNRLKVFVLPSKSEGLPTVLVESLACGTPVVATGVGGIPDIVEDGINGRLLDDPDPEELASVLVNILEDKDGLREMHQSAHRMIDDDYRLPGVQERFRRVLSHK